MSDAPAPRLDLSVIVVTPSGIEAVRETLAALAAQTEPQRIELILVAPRADDTIDPAGGELRRFGRARLVVAEGFPSTGAAVATGIANATAPVVAYAEEHVVPEPGWAGALLAAHRGPWAAVGAGLRNANPRSAVSWASLCTDFGRWLGRTTATEMTSLPPHQTTYKRTVLEPYGDELAELLEVESLLHADLAARGLRLLLEPAAVVRHVNPSRLRSYAASELLGGRLYGAGRAGREGWSVARRLAYVVAAPLIVGVRLRRSIGDLRRLGSDRPSIARVVGPLLVGLAAHTAGEALGYTVGAGDAVRLRQDVELHRSRHLRADDR